jgi:hypothetical protein
MLYHDSCFFIVLDLFVTPHRGEGMVDFIGRHLDEWSAASMSKCRYLSSSLLFVLAMTVMTF